MLLGIKGDKLPTQPEVEYMIKLLQEDYGNLPIGELSFAFDLMVRNKLDENAETYQNFSVLYLTRLMTSYARYIVANIRIPYNPVEVSNQIEYEQKMSDKEKLDFIYEAYTKSKYKNFRGIFMALDAFQIINKIHKFDYKEIYDKTLLELKRNIIDNQSRRDISRIIDNEDEMENMCRRMAVKIYFDNLNHKP